MARGARSWIALIAVVVAGAGLMVGCGDDDDDSSGGGSSGGGESSGPVTVAVVGDFSGQLAGFGKALKAGVDLGANEYNEAGGINGGELNVVTVDLASDPSTAVPKVQRLLESEEPSVAIGLMLSSVREAINPLFEKEDVPFFNATIYEGGACEPNLWNTGPVPNQSIIPLIEHALDQGAKTFVLVGSDYLYGREQGKVAKETIEAGGGKVLSDTYYPLTATDYDKAVGIINSKKPDAVVNNVIVPPTIGLYKALGASGYDGMILHTSLDQVAGKAIGGENLQNTIVATDWLPTLDDEASQRVSQAYEELTGGDPPFSGASMGTAAYRAIRLYGEAVNKAKSTDLEALSEALDGLTIEDMPGGPVTMEPEHHTTMNMYLAEFDKQGDLVPLETLEATPSGQECSF
jgi:ABC-type branched-subunit amino acid transport system substrate-binding protein